MGHDAAKMMDDQETFVQIEPDEPSPVLVEVPHAGLWLDAEAAAWTNCPVRCLPRDADLYVHELFARAPELGATLLYAHISRYLVDLNRGADDYDGQAVQGGHRAERPRGVIWRTSSDGIPVLRQRLPVDEYRRRMRRYHQPYHDAIRRTLERKRAQFGFAVMLCAHSMPSPRVRGRSAASRWGAAGLADIVPGTRGRSSADGAWIDLVEQVSRDHGFTVQHDVPYRGGFTTG
ncbi:MAG: N-formylglutamate amidohydrolase, partial [Myxococcota bacterium]